MAKHVLEVVYEDDDLVAVNKPSGMLTLPDRHDGELESLRGLLVARYGQIFVVHRLDRDTSGLIVFAKNAAAHQYMSKLFEGRDINKYYLGLIMGKPLVNHGLIDAALAEHPAKNGSMVVHHKGKSSLTDYWVEEAFATMSLVKFQIHTGRTHQIRVHAKHLGHPIVADGLYGDGKPVLISSLKKKYKLSKTAEEEKPILNRLALHAFQLEFVNTKGEKQRLEAPLHKDMGALLQQLRKLNGKGTV
ncbi:MAG: RluA family pseudouridine synthase [Bacteroidetes bacterium]|nr:MAG: RluA family pseudouridine synthase [Bacteroidota bacterium]